MSVGEKRKIEKFPDIIIGKPLFFGGDPAAGSPTATLL